MWKKINLDERQLRLRGDMFRHGFVILLALVIIDAFLIDAGINWAEGAWRNIIIVMLAATVCLIEKITRGVLSGERRFGILACFFGLTSILSAVFIAVGVAGGESVITEGMLTDYGVYMVLSAMLFFVFASFIVTRIREAREPADA